MLLQVQKVSAAKVGMFTPALLRAEFRVPGLSTFNVRKVLTKSVVKGVKVDFAALESLPRAILSVSSSTRIEQSYRGYNYSLT